MNRDRDAIDCDAQTDDGWGELTAAERRRAALLIAALMLVVAVVGSLALVTNLGPAGA